MPQSLQPFLPPPLSPFEEGLFYNRAPQLLRGFRFMVGVLSAAPERYHRCAHDSFTSRFLIREWLSMFRNTINLCPNENFL
jgi:hypothetical protein